MTKKVKSDLELTCMIELVENMKTVITTVFPKLKRLRYGRYKKDSN